MQDCCIEVVERVNVLHRLLAQVIRLAAAHAGLHSGPGHPAGEAIRVVIAALRALLEKGHPPELRAPNDQRVLEQTPLLQVADQRGGGLVHDWGVDVVLFLQRVVPIPVELPSARVGSVEELHEAHPALNQPPRQDAVLGKSRLVRVLCIVCAIQLQNVRRFGAQIADLRHAQLHSRGQLVARDTGRQLPIAGMLLQMPGIHPL